MTAIFIEREHMCSPYFCRITKMLYTRVLFAARFKVKYTNTWAAKRKLGSFQRNENVVDIFLFLLAFDRLFLSCIVCLVLFFFAFLFGASLLHDSVLFFFIMRESKCFLNLFQCTLLIHGNKLLLKTLLHFIFCCFFCRNQKPFNVLKFVVAFLILSFLHNFSFVW